MLVKKKEVVIHHGSKQRFDPSALLEWCVMCVVMGKDLTGREKVREGGEGNGSRFWDFRFLPPTAKERGCVCLDPALLGCRPSPFDPAISW